MTNGSKRGKDGKDGGGLTEAAGEDAGKALGGGGGNMWSIAAGNAVCACQLTIPPTSTAIPVRDQIHHVGDTNISTDEPN